MQGLMERALPFLAAWGAWSLAALLAVSLFGVWRLRRSRLGSAGLLILAVVCGGGLYGLVGPMRPMLDQVRYIRGTVGQPAGDLAFRQVADDTPRRLSELRGKVVLVNLWATWCPPCRKELPEIDKLQKDYAGSGLVVVTLSDEERGRLLKFAAEHPLSTLNVYTRQLGWLNVGGRPLSMIIDRQGVVRDCVIGGRDYADFEAKVKKLLATPS
ncbi:MAG TPA: redoxin domain-containing protein [Thermoanaerobaculia bacterium]